MITRVKTIEGNTILFNTSDIVSINLGLAEATIGLTNGVTFSCSLVDANALIDQWRQSSEVI
jgi:hypothetical protein